MSDNLGGSLPPPPASNRKSGQTIFQRRLEQLVSRAKWALWWERAWPILWLPITILLVFLTVSWLGIWLDATPLSRTAGLALFTAAFLISLWPLVRLRFPGRPSAWYRSASSRFLVMGAEM